jgi:hypothetical protein
MYSFFHGWRRKAGVVTLVVACAVFVVWIRSTIITDTLWIHSGTQFHQVHSCRGFFWWESREAMATPRWKWTSYRTQYWEDVGSWTKIIRHDRTGSAKLVIIAYWPLVVIPTLLSAYLILWKPQKRVKSDA